jgi:Trk K+ transport system NAD-binding subunit
VKHLQKILDNTLIINGDCRDADFWNRKAFSKWDVFIAVTGNSEINICHAFLQKEWV